MTMTTNIYTKLHEQRRGNYARAHDGYGWDFRYTTNYCMDLFRTSNAYAFYVIIILPTRCLLLIVSPAWLYYDLIHIHRILHSYITWTVNICQWIFLLIIDVTVLIHISIWDVAIPKPPFSFKSILGDFETRWLRIRNLSLSLIFARQPEPQICGDCSWK